MAIATKTFAPFRRLAHVFFRRQVRLRVDGGLRVELADTSKGPRPPTAVEQAAARERADSKRILADLKQLLDADIDTRASVRFLVFVEQALLAQGSAALNSVPLEVLGRALDQFEALVTNWSPVGLASLRSRMAVTLNERRLRDDENDAFVPQAMPRVPAAPQAR